MSQLTGFQLILSFMAWICRFALICQQCHTHNGMALREEFENLAFICFKCGLYNPARNTSLMYTSMRSITQSVDTEPTVEMPIRTETSSDSSVSPQPRVNDFL